jgi:hypothetical protein
VREWDVLGFVEKEQYKGTSLIDADLWSNAMCFHSLCYLQFVVFTYILLSQWQILLFSHPESLCTIHNVTEYMRYQTLHLFPRPKSHKPPSRRNLPRRPLRSTKYVFVIVVICVWGYFKHVFNWQFGYNKLQVE